MRHLDRWRHRTDRSPSGSLRPPITPSPQMMPDQRCPAAWSNMTAPIILICARRMQDLFTVVGVQIGGDVRVDQLSIANTLSDTVLSYHHDPGAPGSPIIRSQLPMLTPVLEVRRLSFRRRADVGRCRTPVRSARAMCCLWVVNTMTHVSGVSRGLPIATLARPDFRRGVLAGPRCLASRDQVSTRKRSRHDHLQGPAFRLRSARTRPGSSATGPAACVNSRSRVRSCDAGG